MSNIKVTDQMIYRFLAQYEKDDQSWHDSADRNGDGIVTKNEFCSFLDEWDTAAFGAAPSNDVINNFFRKLDTQSSGASQDRLTGKNGIKLSNKNALGASELNAMAGKMEMYVKFNELVKEYKNNLTKEIFNNLSLEGRQEWNTRFEEGMNALLNSVTSLDGLKKSIDANVNAIANQATAGAYAVDIITSLRNGELVKYGYDIKGDTDLDKIINDYVETLAGNNTLMSPDEIKEKVETLINSYVTAPFNGTLTDGQRQMLSANIQKNITPDAQKEATYKGNEAIYGDLIKKYADAMADVATSFDVTAFTFADMKAKGYLADIQTTIERYNAAQDAKTKIKNINLTTELGEDIWKLVKNAGIIDKLDVETAVKNGEIATNGKNINEAALKSWTIEQVKSNLESVFTNGYNNVSADKVDTVHNKRMEIIKSADYTKQAEETGKTVDDIRLENAKNAGVDYCNAIAKKSDEHKEVVNKADYINKINNAATISEVESIISDLKAEIAKIKDLTKIKLNNIPEQECYTNMTHEFNVGVTNPDNVAVTYSIENSTGATVKINKVSGEITFNATEADVYKFNVNVVVNGKVIATKEVTVKVNSINNEDIIKDAKFNKNNNGSNINDLYISYSDMSSYNFNSLYSNDTALILFTANKDNGKLDFDNTKVTVRENLSNVLNNIVTGLTNAGLDSNILNKCKDSVLKQYMDNFTGIDVNPWCGDPDQKEANNAAYNHVNTNRNQLSYALARSNILHADNHSVMVNFKDLVDDMLAKYFELSK